MKKLIHIMLCLMLSLAFTINVYAEDTMTMKLDITYLGSTNTNPTYVVLVQIPSLPTYETYEPITGSYTLTNTETRETTTGIFSSDGSITVSGSWTIYTIEIPDLEVGTSIQFSEQSGMNIGDSDNADQGVLFTVSNNSSANHFSVTVGNERTLEDVAGIVRASSADETDEEEESAVEEETEDVLLAVESEKTSVSTAEATTETERDCSSYGEGYVYDRIHGACVLETSPSASPSATAAVSISSLTTLRTKILIVGGSIVGLAALFWAVFMLRKYRG